MRGVVQDAVQAPQLLIDALGHGLVIIFRGIFQVQRKDQRLRQARSQHLVVDRFQLVLFASGQYHRGTVLCEGQRCRTAQPLAGTGDQNHAVFQAVSSGRMFPECCVRHVDLSINDFQ